MKKRKKEKKKIIDILKLKKSSKTQHSSSLLSLILGMCRIFFKIIFQTIHHSGVVHVLWRKAES